MKQTGLIAAAFVAGLVGGIAGSRFAMTGDRGTNSVVRARSFELVDETGQAISFWGVDQGHNAVLAFGSRSSAGTTSRSLENPDNQLASFGLNGPDPWLKMSGPDGKTRLQMFAAIDAKPQLLMEDEIGPRIRLGVQRGDTLGPNDNDWALVFSKERAMIGMVTEKIGGQNYVRGVFSVNKDKIRYPDQSAK